MVDAVTAGANASSRVVCGELDRDADSCRLTGALIAGALLAGALLAGAGGATIVEGVGLGLGGAAAIVLGPGSMAAIVLELGRMAVIVPADRKSTRLNSSH